MKIRTVEVRCLLSIVEGADYCLILKFREHCNCNIVKEEKVQVIPSFLKTPFKLNDGSILICTEFL